jgi:hypothetical protein
MNEDEEYKTKENGQQEDGSLPQINKGKDSNQFFQMDDFNSKESDGENKPKLVSPTVIDPANKIQKNMMNTSDKLNGGESNVDTHKPGVLKNKDTKTFGKIPSLKSQGKNDETPYDHSKPHGNEEKHFDDDSHMPAAANEIIYKERKKCPKCPESVTKVLNKILENNVYIIFMTIVTIYALFADDFRLLLSPKSGDPVFWSLTCVAMFLFAVELLMASFAQKDYFLGFYFWLDLIATVSLLTDIGWIYNEIVGGGDISADNASQASSLARAGRGARVGTRAGRIVRLVRLIRIVKLYKHAHKALEKTGPNEDEKEDMTAEELAQIHAKNAEAQDSPKESHVGQQLSDLTTRRVITIVLIMMFSVPLLTLNTYVEEPNSFEWGLRLISVYENDKFSDGWNETFNTFISESGGTDNPVVSLNADGETYNSEKTSLDELRTLEVLIATYGGDKYVSVHDNRDNIKLGAGLGIGRTIFICLVLTIAAM